MSLILQLPPGTQFYQPVARFTAQYNSPTVGFYDFGIAANAGVTFLDIKKNALYLIERYSFSATAYEGDYLQACSGAGAVVPDISLRLPKETDRMIYPQPIPLPNYIDGLETLIYAYSNQDQALTATVHGQLSQPAAMVGISEITAQFQANIYEVKNKRWIDNFIGTTRHGQAPDLVLPMQGRRRGAR